MLAELRPLELAGKIARRRQQGYADALFRQGVASDRGDGLDLAQSLLEKAVRAPVLGANLGDTDLLPSFRTYRSMISGEGRGKVI